MKIENEREIKMLKMKSISSVVDELGVDSSDVVGGGVFVIRKECRGEIVSVDWVEEEFVSVEVVDGVISICLSEDEMIEIVKVEK